MSEAQAATPAIRQNFLCLSLLLIRILINLFIGLERARALCLLLHDQRRGVIRDSREIYYKNLFIARAPLHWAANLLKLHSPTQHLASNNNIKFYRYSKKKILMLHHVIIGKAWPSSSWCQNARNWSIGLLLRRCSYIGGPIFSFLLCQPPPDSTRLLIILICLVKIADWSRSTRREVNKRCNIWAHRSWRVS